MISECLSFAKKRRLSECVKSIKITEFTQLLTLEFKAWNSQVHCYILFLLKRKILLLP